MSLGCAGGACGDCCDPVGLSGNIIAIIETWREWFEQGIIGPLPNIDPSVRFAIEHWRAYEGPLTASNDQSGHRDYLCDRFNPVTRLCEAYEDRPPVCSRYPHYGPEGQISVDGLEKRCSFWLDVPVQKRPEGVRPLIPISVKERT